MEKKFIVPATTFLGGIAIWLLFFFLFGSEDLDLWLTLIFGVAIGGLIIISANSCRRAGGPKTGNLFRSGILVVMAILTYWKIGISTTILLFVSGIVTLLIALNTKQSEGKLT